MTSAAVVLGVYFVAIFGATTILNFAAIHTMANIVLYKGSSRLKSLSLSMELGLLSSCVAVLMLTLAHIMGYSVLGGLGPVVYGVFGSSGLLVELFKIWYVQKAYDTTLVYAIIIAEGFTLILYMFIAVLANTVLALI